MSDELFFGRRPAPDARDGRYGMRAALGADVPPLEARTGRRIWESPYPALNQGAEGTCVGHGCQHHLLSEPIVQKTPEQSPTAVEVYDLATELDEWPNNTHDRSFGTSVRAGFKALQRLGYVAEYRHAQSLDDVLLWLADRGPVVIGVDWYEGMAYRQHWTGPYLELTGSVIGGHCVCLIGVDFDERYVLLRNSWGPLWGPTWDGTARLRFADLERLLFREGGDAIAGLEVALGPAPDPTPPTPPEPEPEPPAPPAPDPQFPWQETYPWRYDRERDMWVWRFVVGRHTGGWDDLSSPPPPPNGTVAPQYPYQETVPMAYDPDLDALVYEFRIQRGTGDWSA